MLIHKKRRISNISTETTHNNSSNNILLNSRNKLSFSSKIEPWTITPNNVNIMPFLKKDDNLTKKEKFELAL